MTATGITGQWAMEKMAINRAIRHLLRTRRVKRRPDSRDRRRFSLYLTANGKRLYDKVIPDANRRYREIVACLSKTELTALRRVMDKLSRHTLQLTD